MPKELKQRMQDYFQTMWSLNHGIDIYEVISSFNGYLFVHNIMCGTASYGESLLFVWCVCAFFFYPVCVVAVLKILLFNVVHIESVLIRFG